MESLALGIVGLVALGYLSFLGIAASDRGKPVLGKWGRGPLRVMTLGPTIFVVGAGLTIWGMVLLFVDSRDNARQQHDLLTGGDSFGYVVPYTLHTMTFTPDERR